MHRKKPCGAGRASSGRDRNLRSKTDSQHSVSLSLLANRALLETWNCSKRAPSLNIWPSLNIEPTLSQISEETLESLKLCERNSRASNSTEQPNNQKGIPRVTSRDDDTWDSFNQPGNETTDQRHFNLKQVSNNLYSTGTGRIYL